MAAERVSEDYPYLLVPVDRPGFGTEDEAVKDVSRGWGLRLPGYRGPCFVARIVARLEPNYEVMVDKTQLLKTKRSAAAKRRQRKAPRKRKARR
jgi:hypothetical protein